MTRHEPRRVGAPRGSAWGRLGSVQVRTTAVAVIVVGLALLFGALTLVASLRDNLTDNVRVSAKVRAGEIAAALESGVQPPVLAVSEQDEALIQILDHNGAVVASSPNIADRPPVTHLPDGGWAEISTPLDDDRFLAVAEVARTPDGVRTVIVARALADTLSSTNAITRLLAYGLPALLLLVGLTTWAVVGWALTPVAVMRREVDSISGAQLHRRVAQPASGDEISRLARTMNRMLDRLEGAQASQRRFVSDVSHELRSPVASIRQHAEVALAHPRRTTVGGLAAPVHAETLRVQHLVEDLLLLARADESGLSLRRTPVDLDDLVFQQAERLRATTALRVDTSGVSAGQVTGDPSALGRMLRNLADNAARHAHRTVRFGLGTVAGAAGSGKRQTVVLTVEDDGPGVPESERERVLQRFVRLDDARARDSGGSGLGLAIVSELVNAHDGAIDIGVGDLGGARIRITLPSAS